MGLNVTPGLAARNPRDGGSADGELQRDFSVAQPLPEKFPDSSNVECRELGHTVSRSLRTRLVHILVGVVLFACGPREVLGSIVVANAVEVSAVELTGARSDERSQNDVVYGHSMTLAIAAQRDPPVSLDDFLSHHSGLSKVRYRWPTRMVSLHDDAFKRPHTTATADFVVGKSGDHLPRFHLSSLSGVWQ